MAENREMYKRIKGVVQYLREETTANRNQVLMFAVVGGTTEVCFFFPPSNEEVFNVSLSGYCFKYIIHKMNFIVIVKPKIKNKKL